MGEEEGAEVDVGIKMAEDAGTGTGLGFVSSSRAPGPPHVSKTTHEDQWTAWCATHRRPTIPSTVIATFILHYGLSGTIAERVAAITFLSS